MRKSEKRKKKNRPTNKAKTNLKEIVKKEQEWNINEKNGKEIDRNENE